MGKIAVLISTIVIMCAASGSCWAADKDYFDNTSPETSREFAVRVFAEMIDNDFDLKHFADEIVIITEKYKNEPIFIRGSLVLAVQYAKMSNEFSLFLYEVHSAYQNQYWDKSDAVLLFEVPNVKVGSVIHAKCKKLYEEGEKLFQKREEAEQLRRYQENYRRLRNVK